MPDGAQFPRATIVLAGVVAGVTLLLVTARVARAQEGADPYAAIAMRAFEAKRSDIIATMVTPCKTSQEAAVKPAIEHYTTCDCFAREEDRQTALAELRLAEQRAIAKCDLDGLDAQLAYINVQEGAVRDALRDMVRKFQAQAGSFAAWGSDANQGEKAAQAKIGEIIVSNGVGLMVDNIISMNEEEMTKRIGDMVTHAESVKDVRRVRTKDLSELVVAMKTELRGTSKAEANTIVLGELRAAQASIKDVALVEKQLSERIVDANIPRDDERTAEEQTQAYLTGGYAALLTDIKILANHGVRDAKVLAPATGVLALAPDAIDTAAILYNASAIGDNLSGLEQLRAAAEQQRVVLSAQMKALVGERQAVTTERARTKQAAAL